MNKKLFKQDSPTNILRFDEDGEPIPPLAMNEFDDETFRRVGLEWERAYDLEKYLAENFRMAREDEDIAIKQWQVTHLLVEAHKENLERELSGKKWNRSSHWASGHFSCGRSRGFDFMEEDIPQEFPAIENELTFEIGRNIGLFAALAVARAGILEGAEVYFRDDIPGLLLPRSGKADIKLRDPTNNNKVIPAEVKSANTDKYNDKQYGRKTVEGMAKIPRKSHVAQLFDYIHTHNVHEDYEDTDYGYLFYFDKNDSSFAIHRIFWNQAFWDETVYDNSYIEYYLSRGKLPPRHPNAKAAFYKVGEKKGEPNPNQCHFPCGGAWGLCKYIRHCWQEGEEDNVSG